MTYFQQILRGIQIAIEEDGPVAAGIEIDTTLRAMSSSDSVYRHEDIVMAVFGSRVPNEELPEEAEDA